MRQGPGLEGSEGRCCVGSARSLGLDRRWGRETPTQELLTHQVACRAQGLVSDVQFGEEPLMLILLMMVIISYFVTIEQNQSAEVNFGSSSL